MGRKAKYNTPEEKRAAMRAASKAWYEKHKNDASFIMRRRWYQTKYYDKLNVTKKDFLREYNTDYVFYIRNVRTGKLEKRIVQDKEALKKLEQSIFEKETRLRDLTQRFGHLEHADKKPI